VKEGELCGFNHIKSYAAMADDSMDLTKMNVKPGEETKVDEGWLLGW